MTKIADDLLPERSVCGYCRGNCDHDSATEGVMEWIERYRAMDDHIFQRRLSERRSVSEPSEAMKVVAKERELL
jgi:ribosomal protein S12 methylthiotransferase accessory factor YcaO